MRYKASYNNAHALIIGIDRYDYLNDLATAVRGANAVKDILESTYGFKTTQLLDANATDESIDSWFRSLQVDLDDQVIIYFAGHGVNGQLHGRKIGYIALKSTRETRNFDDREYVNAYSMPLLVEKARQLRAKHVLIILDTCFSSLAFVHYRGSNSSIDTEIDKYIEDSLSRPVRYMITAGGEEQVDDSLSPDGFYSAFTYHLLVALRSGKLESGEVLSAKGLAIQIERKVTSQERTAHRPQHGAFVEFDGDFGDFLLFRIPESFQPGDLQKCQVISRLENPNDLTDDVRILLSQLHETIKLEILQKITSGKSGSNVFKVNVIDATTDKIRGIHYCKVYNSESGDEVERYLDIQNTAIGKYIPPLVDYSPLINKRMASLYKIAYQSVGADTIPLSDLIHSNSAAARDAIVQLINIMSEWNQPLQKTDTLHPQGLFQLMLQRFIPGSNNSKSDIVESLRSLVDGLSPASDSIGFPGYDLPNPLAYLLRNELWRTSRNIIFPVGHSHGDLHTNNVICSVDSAKQTIASNPAIIDFDNYEDRTCMFYDLAYLEIDLSMRMLNPKDEGHRQSWPEISKYMAQNIQFDDLPSIESKYVPLHVLVRPLRRHIHAICQSAPEDHSISYWIARSAAGLSFARKRKVDAEERRLALLLSAHSLGMALQLSGTKYRPTSQLPFSIDWLPLKR